MINGLIKEKRTEAVAKKDDLVTSSDVDVFFKIWKTIHEVQTHTGMCEIIDDIYPSTNHPANLEPVLVVESHKAFSVGLEELTREKGLLEAFTKKEVKTFFDVDYYLSTFLNDEHKDAPFSVSYRAHHNQTIVVTTPSSKETLSFLSVVDKINDFDFKFDFV